MTAPTSVGVLSVAAGLDLAGYREEHVAQRVEEALRRTGAPHVDALGDLLRRDRDARSRFRRSIAISVTSLFRDPQQFEILERELAASGARPPRVWSAGCSDGSELWSVAAILRRLGLLEGATLLGSDVLEENLARAWVVPPELPELAELPTTTRVRFEQRDLLHDGPPPGSWTTILCRNVAIYLAPGTRSALHRMLVDALAPGGLLLLGRSERLSMPRAMGMRLVAPHAYRKVP